MTAVRNILVRGGGVAARCSAHLLRRAGFQVFMEQNDRPRVPAILLSDAALDLIRDAFGIAALFTDKPRVNHRIVAWGEGAEAVVVPHGAIVVSEKQLLQDLPVADAPPPGFAPDFTIQTVTPLPVATMIHRFGARRAVAAQVSLKEPEDVNVCWIESLERGWLFLIPGSDRTIWLLAVGGLPEELLMVSQLIAPRIDLLPLRSGEFDTCPTIVSPSCGQGWLACGTAAMAFDPLCGDGTAQAVREAILAAGVVRALACGEDAGALLTHFETILIGAMRRHLYLCESFYRTGGTGPWWQAEQDALKEGHRWCTAQLAVAPEPRYQLRGFELIAREPALGP